MACGVSASGKRMGSRKSGRSAAVSTASTPGVAAAASTSTPRSRPCATMLRRRAPTARPGRVTSATKRRARQKRQVLAAEDVRADGAHAGAGGHVPEPPAASGRRRARGGTRRSHGSRRRIALARRRGRRRRDRLVATAQPSSNCSACRARAASGDAPERDPRVAARRRLTVDTASATRRSHPIAPPTPRTLPAAAGGGGRTARRSSRRGASVVLYGATKSSCTGIVGGSPGARARNDLRLERRGRHAELGGGIRMGDAAAERPATRMGRMPDVRRRLAEDTPTRRGARRVSSAACRVSAPMRSPRRSRRSRRGRRAIDVDEHRRPNEPERIAASRLCPPAKLASPSDAASRVDRLLADRRAGSRSGAASSVPRAALRRQDGLHDRRVARAPGRCSTRGAPQLASPIPGRARAPRRRAARIPACRSRTGAPGARGVAAASDGARRPARDPRSSGRCVRPPGLRASGTTGPARRRGGRCTRRRRRARSRGAFP